MPESNGTRYVTYRFFVTTLFSLMALLIGGPLVTIWSLNNTIENRLDQRIEHSRVILTSSISDVYQKASENSKDIREINRDIANIYKHIGENRRLMSPSYFHFYRAPSERLKDDQSPHERVNRGD